VTALLNPPPTPVARPARLAHFGPNWFAAVMGTGIVANAAALLPVHVRGLASAALAIWVLAAALLVGLVIASAAHVRLHPLVAAGHHRDLAMAPFYGAPAMALLTVGSGALLAGQPLLGPHLALAVDATLWTLGTAGGLVCAVGIPFLMVTLHRPRLEDTFGSWLMAVVPPMVSATAGAGLVAHLPPGQTRLTLELICGACFGVSLVLVAILLPMLWARLLRHGVGPASTVPTLWIVLGPLGQSVTAAGLLGAASHSHLLLVASVLYGVPVWGFAIAWMVIAALITVRTAREHLPFSLSWWSFTFPIGTVVTGTSELAQHTHAEVLSWTAAGLFGLLIVAWATVAVRTLAGVRSGTLFGRA
jgi:C4-dicarboxylate transporter/malic acid transport protein